MQTPIEGAIYEDTNREGSRLKCVSSPDVFGLSTMETENETFYFVDLETDSKFSIFVDNFQRGYRKIAESESELTA